MEALVDGDPVMLSRLKVGDGENSILVGKDVFDNSCTMVGEIVVLSVKVGLGDSEPLLDGAIVASHSTWSQQWVQQSQTISSQSAAK